MFLPLDNILDVKVEASVMQSCVNPGNNKVKEKLKNCLFFKRRKWGREKEEREETSRQSLIRKPFENLVQHPRGSSARLRFQRDPDATINSRRGVSFDSEPKFVDAFKLRNFFFLSLSWNNFFFL